MSPVGNYLLRQRGPRAKPPKPTRVPGTRHKVGDRIRLDSGETVTVVDVKLCGPNDRRDYLHIFDNGLTLTGREILMNTRGGQR